MKFDAMMQDSDIEAHREEAQAWVIRLLPGNATTADLAAFKRWCERSSAHAQAFVEARRLWEATKPAGRALFDRIGAPALPARPAGQSKMGRRAFLGGALAASSAAVALTAARPPFHLWPSLGELWEADYRTVTGEQRHLTLPGDISVAMNTRTSLALRPKSGNADRIELLSGEGAVTVGPQALEIVAAQGRVWARDAKVNVRRDDDRVRVTCLDGKVRITCGQNEASLGVGQQLAYSDQGLETIVGIDPDIVAAWQTGFLVFHETPLVDVVAEVNRYRRGRIILTNTALGHRTINARFRLDRIDEVVVKLKEAFGATAVSLPGDIVILS